jgi:diacylglycerol kinase family enzyme
MPSTVKYHFLINPVSGGGEGKGVFELLPEIMASMAFAEADWKRELLLPETLETQVASALEGTERLIAVGGDGTVSAVFKALWKSERKNDVKIGLIPLGTGNDLARALGLYKAFVNEGLLALVRKLILAPDRAFDVWEVNGERVMSNYFSAGIDARIAHDFNADRKSGKLRASSVLANKLHYVKRFFADRKHKLTSGLLRFEGENGRRYDYRLTGDRTVIVGNIPSFAGGANPFGDSKMDDGFLEVLRVPNLPRFLSAILFARFWRAAGVQKATEVVIEPTPNEYLQLDGEDLTGKLSLPVRIRFAYQARVLYLPE